MTTLIQQRSPSDCVLASIAMAAGKSAWTDLWTDADLAEIAGKGISTYEPWMERAGLGQPYVDYWEVYVGQSMNTFKCMLWKRRALLSIHSINNDGGHHSVYWDGDRIWDPNEGIPGKIAMPFLHSAIISRAWIFKA
jgi:hypothetical protein